LFFVRFVRADGSCRLGRNLFPPERTCIIYLSTMAWRDLVRFQKDDGAIIWPKSSSSSSYSCPVVWATTGITTITDNNPPPLNQNNRPIITKNNPPSESYKNYYAVSRRAECYSIWFKFLAKKSWVSPERMNRPSPTNNHFNFSIKKESWSDKKKSKNQVSPLRLTPVKFVIPFYIVYRTGV
jgi:hypothetical protein